MWLKCTTWTHALPSVRLQVDEWRGRASRFLSLCEDVAQLHCSVVGGANRAVLYDLYPYVWDLRNMALVAKAFICWLGKYTQEMERVLQYSNVYDTSCSLTHSRVSLRRTTARRQLHPGHLEELLSL